MKMWGGDDDGRIYRSSSGSPAYSLGRGHHTKRYWILENERGTIAKHILSGETTATMGTIKQQRKYFPDIVMLWKRAAKKKTNPFTFHA